MKLYTRLEQKTTAAAYRSMSTYTVLNFLVLLLVFSVTFMSIFIGGYRLIDSGVKTILMDNITIIQEEGLENFDSAKYPSSMKFIGYDKEGHIINNEKSTVIPDNTSPENNIVLSDIENYSIKELILKLDFDQIDNVELFNQENVSDNYAAYTVKINAVGDFCYVRAIMPINDIAAFKTDFIKMIPYYLPISIIVIMIAALVIAYYQCMPNISSIKSSNRFTSDVSHELNTPLSIVQSNLQDMLEDPEMKICEKSLQLTDALSEVKRLQKLTSQLLVIAKSDSSKLTINPVECNIQELLNRVTEPYQMMAEVDGKDFEIKIDSFNYVINLDVDLFIQILTALLDNAIKYTKEGEKITVVLTAEKNNITLAIQDTGAGVSTAELSKIFNRFYRSDEARNTRGTGLGLSIVQSVVQAQGGSISAHNLNPVGFEVRIKIPN